MNDFEDYGREVTKKWYEEFPKGAAPFKHSKTDVEVLDLKDEAKKHLDGETAAYQLKQSKIKNSEHEWCRTASAKGTGSVKVAANVILIQDNPKYTLARLVGLISQVKVSKQNQATHLISALADLFLGDLLHPQHKLLKFEEQDLDKIPGLNDTEQFTSEAVPRRRLLSHWYFEDQLREQYDKFLTNLAAVASDTVDANREKAVSVMTDLLIGNPEQEHKLLEFIINKIGDPKSKVASKAIFCLNKLLFEHSNMKLVVLREVEKLLFRPNIGQRAQYYAICLLTQYVLDKDDTECATTLIEVYFAFFKASLKKGEPDSRMMAAILTGVNRAYKFSNLNSIKLNENIDAVYKVVHLGSFNVSLNALSLLHQVVSNNPAQENRFFTAFYRKLLDLQIGVAQKRAIFLNLLYRVMKNDKSVSRVYAFVKRILQVAAYYPACMASATLYVVSQVIQSRKDLKQLMTRGHVMTIKKEITLEEDKPEEEIDTSDIEEIVQEKKKEDTIILSNLTTSADEGINSNENEEGKKDIVKIEEDNHPFYDPFAINPLASGAVKAPVTELVSLYRHFHPTIALFAEKVIRGEVIDYTGDPLEDLTTIRFLDRYVFKNPKKLDEKKVVKQNDPLAVRAKYTPKGLRAIPVDSQAYLNQDEQKIPVDELFLYKYLKNKNTLKSIKKEREDDEEDEDDDDNVSVNSEEFNDMMDQLSGEKDFEDLDIAADFGTSKKKKGKSRKGVEEEEEDDDDDEDEDADEDEDMEFDDDEEEDELLGGDDDEDFGDMDENDDDLGLDEIDDDMSEIEFNDSDDEESSKSKKPAKFSLPKASGKKGRKGEIDSNVFVSAEEFAEMLEQQGKTKSKAGGSNVFSDADGAAAKQIDWESNRNRKIEGKFRGKKRSFGNKGSKVNKKNSKKFKR